MMESKVKCFNMSFKNLNLLIKILILLIAIALIIVLIWLLFFKSTLINQEATNNTVQNKQKTMKQENSSNIILPEPNKDSEVSIEQTLLNRRSVRRYKDEALNLQEISQILWSAQGITSSWGGRTAPSAGALYPLEIYLAVRKAENIEPGVYHYIPQGHKLEKVLNNDVSSELTKSALSQVFIERAPVNLIISGIFSRTTGKYGERGIQYIYMEAGHSAQNVYLQVQSLGLGTVVIGAFNDEEIKNILNLSEHEIPLYIMPVGRVF